MTPSLRVIVADDSALYRAVLTRCLTSLGGVEVVARAANGAEALQFVREFKPDLLTLDLNMPVMDGLAALRSIRGERLDCEVIVVSSQTRQGALATLDALSLGAVDFVTKPNEDNARDSTELLGHELRRQLAAVRLRRARRQQVAGDARAMARPNTSSLARIGPVAPAPKRSLPPEVVAIGTSTGGPSALPVLLSTIPADFPVPILIVQHMPPLFTASLAESLARKCQVPVVEAKDGDRVVRGQVYIAPGGRHMKIQRTRERLTQVVVTDDPPINFCRPSVDVLFSSVVAEYGGRVVAAILTGMGNDGVAGLRELKAAGATVIAQNEETCTVFGMPQEAIRAAVVDSILPLDRISPAIVDLVRGHA